MKFNKLFQFILFVFLLIFLLNSSYNYILNTFIIKTEILQETTYLKGYDTSAYIFSKEGLVKANTDGVFKPGVSEGQRVGKKQVLGHLAGKEVLSPVSGIVSFKYDKLEEADNPFESSTFNLEAIKEFNTVFDNSNKESYLQGEILLKISDNLDKGKVYLELPITSFKEPIKEKDIIKLKFTDDDTPLKAQVTDLKGIGQNAILLLNFLDRPTNPARIEEVKIITDEIKTYLIPPKAIVDKDGRTGVYQVSKGMVVFKEINILEEDGYIFTDSFTSASEIISNPRFVSEGRYIR